MIIPVRCFSCGKVIGDMWESYLRMLDAGIADGDAMDKLGCKRFCCRRMIMTHVDLIEKLLKSICPPSRKMRVLIRRLDTIPQNELD
ncbi:MAG: DNA-directed RNA Polymerase II subunit L [Alectoria fallacina]|uniref:DNA-directed RNA polymerases I, II, and III subunit RPABC5 n=1 Tax=Alectoria fallacina TaxID=1903189 RepID=A0A8H3PIJ5_9LECA|nr:MAG: DNA-directed RNA Polymerase II subunit L [Alectoria fallacina]